MTQHRLASVPLQHVLFFLPYANIAWTGAYLLIMATENVLAVILGIQMIAFLMLYLGGLMGSHYIKVYCFMTNMLYMAIFILYLLYVVIVSTDKALDALWFSQLSQLLALWWIPQVGNIVYLLALPSISEIIPNKLYLGNAMAAVTPGLLKSFHITHVLELHDDQKKNDPSKVDAKELLQLKCSDYLGAEDSLLAVAPQAMEYMNKVLLQEEDKKDARLFVHCAAGGSRSPAMIVHWLVSSGREKTVVDAVKTVRKGRPFVDISSDHLGAVIDFHSNKSAEKKVK